MFYRKCVCLSFFLSVLLLYVILFLMSLRNKLRPQKQLKNWEWGSDTWTLKLATWYNTAICVLAYLRRPHTVQCSTAMHKHRHPPTHAQNLPPTPHPPRCISYELFLLKRDTSSSDTYKYREPLLYLCLCLLWTVAEDMKCTNSIPNHAVLEGTQSLQSTMLYPLLHPWSAPLL